MDTHPAQRPPAPEPLVTPRLIAAALSSDRTVEVTAIMELPLEDAPQSVAIEMLALLKEPELRRLARAIGVPEDGEYTLLFRRLSTRC
jgi:hypothetical protein